MVKKMSEKIRYGLRGILIKHVSDKGIVFTTHEELSKLIVRTETSFFFKWIKM